MYVNEQPDSVTLQTIEIATGMQEFTLELLQPVPLFHVSKTNT
jgi:hypothetical protein